MKFFSLAYSLRSDDYSSYMELVYKSTKFLRLKRLIFPLLLMAGILAYSIYNRDYLSILIYILVTLITFTGLIYTKGRNKVDEKRMSPQLKKELTVDFYEDHFVVQTKPDQYSKSFSERHYGFDTVMGVVETVEYFYFVFRTNNILIIPKRFLSEEKSEMIKNLISNLFMKIYRRF